MNPMTPTPIGEADLQAYVDGRLGPQRLAEVQVWLDAHPDEAARVAAYRADRRDLQAWFAPVLEQPVPTHLQVAARGPAAAEAGWRRWPMAAAALLAVVSGLAGTGLGWQLHARHAEHLAAAAPLAAASVAAAAAEGVQPLAKAAEFAQRAAVAHVVFTPEVKRPVEVDAAHEDQLVTWLSKRMGAPMKAPHLHGLGFELEGGRLLPGRQRPVAQFMYRDATGRRLTLYVSDEVGAAGTPGETAFRRAREGALHVFYWVDGRYGYAISADAPRELLDRVSAEVYRQLGRRSEPDGSGSVTDARRPVGVE